MKRFLTKCSCRVRKFHRNESGMETLQVIMILALGAIVAVAIYQFGSQAVQYCWESFHGQVSK